MQQSVLLCISTILDSGNHYTKMMELVDGAILLLKRRCTNLCQCSSHCVVCTDFGKTVFETIKITLVSVRSIGRTAASTS